MGPVVDAVVSSTEFPSEAGVVVVGGGIVGVATALSLARRGVNAVVLEKGIVAGEQSSRNWGWCRQTGRDLRELPLIVESMRMWETMNVDTGRETGFRRHGILYASKSQDKFERHQAWADEARARGIHSRLLSRDELRRQMPVLPDSCVGGLYTASDGRAEPQKAASAMAQAAMDLGVNLQQQCAVRSIETSNGAVTHVVTEQGRIRTDAVVVAGGAWSRLLMKGLDTRLPQLKVLSNVVRTRPLSLPIEPCVSLGSVAFRQRLDGGWTVATSATNIADVTPDSIRFLPQFLPAYLVERASLKMRFGQRFVDEALHWRPGAADRPSIYEAIRVLDPQPHRPTIDRMLDNLKREIPAFGKVEVSQSWAGLIDTMPDAIPVISQVDSLRGVVVATGFSGHGFGIAPAAGALAADLVCGDTPIVDPSPFRLSRFSGAEKVRAQHWL
ncbi:4-methylaminobutanoate oxidase (formaldehyde-forming) [Paraburkholderia domus]|uniref:NAD(P)/FAD-dependent oxidoreductase n=1 Tax=Paraburkholderia domus TaxID=2793075 RepID=UPI001911E678|nr:FAD-binding oxidoreductase [Paraburkholderia domus]MBK5091402.1 FAD-binding oxidoreductase [Burkholderia sp. R-69927]CAE6935728.1 4-methylaminobutanoate oxidase (formaldehyde-forming) [Paraburkholderia domus]